VNFVVEVEAIYGNEPIFDGQLLCVSEANAREDVARINPAAVEVARNRLSASW